MTEHRSHEEPFLVEPKKIWIKPMTLQWGANIVLALLLFASAAYVRRIVVDELKDYVRAEIFSEYRRTTTEALNRMVGVDENLAKARQDDRETLIRIEEQIKEVKRLLEKLNVTR